MLSSKNAIINLNNYAGKKFNFDLHLMTIYIIGIFEKANLMQCIENANCLEDIKLTYEEACRVAKISKIPINELLK